MRVIKGLPCQPMSFDDLTKVQGPTDRHLEQLWDEIHRLKEDVKVLKEMVSDTSNRLPKTT